MPLSRSHTIGTSAVASGNATKKHNRSASFAAAAAANSSSSNISSSSTEGKQFGYVSLKDLISAPGSPANSPAAMSSPDSIAIRHHLVKQAAWAYLQPVGATSPTSTAEHYIRRLLRNPFFSLIRAAARAVADALSSCFV